MLRLTSACGGFQSECLYASAVVNEDTAHLEIFCHDSDTNILSDAFDCRASSFVSLNLQLEPGDRKHYKKTTLTYLRGYAMDETPVHADLEPPLQPTEEGSSQNCSSAMEAATCSNSQLVKNPKWLEYDKKASHPSVVFQGHWSNLSVIIPCCIMITTTSTVNLARFELQEAQYTSGSVSLWTVLPCNVFSSLPPKLLFNICMAD